MAEPSVIVFQTMSRLLQNDVRAIQLAKAALYAGFRLLMDKMDIDRVDNVVLAGAFGTHIEPKYAMVLGMIPDCVFDKVKPAEIQLGQGHVSVCLTKVSVAVLKILFAILRKLKQQLSHLSRIIS